MAQEIRFFYDGKLIGTFLPNPELGFYAEGWFGALVEGFVRHKNAGAAEHYSLDYDEGQEAYSLEIAAHGKEMISVNAEPAN